MRFNVFSKKTLRVVVQLTEQKFGGKFLNLLEFSENPVDVSINLVNDPGVFSANVRIYGVSDDKMRQMTLIKWREVAIPERAIRIYSNDGDGERLLYEGNIMSATPVYEAPNVFIEIQSVAGAYFNMMSDIPPVALDGEVPILLVFEKICSNHGVTLINHGVEGSCRNPYFDQEGMLNRLNAACDAYGVFRKIHNSYVEIYPADNLQIYTKNWEFKQGEYIGYPRFTNAGIRLTLDYVLDINIGDSFEIIGSQVPCANSKWSVIKVTFNLSTKIGGKWFMEIDGSMYVGN